MDLFIHIGFPKTGSTAIQSHVFSNRGWLINRGVYVPESGYGSGAGHQHILPALGNAKSLREAPVLMNLVEELSSAERNGFQRALITWEGLAGAKTQQIEALASIFSKHNVILLSYVRENSERFQSGVLQQIERLNSDGSARRILDRGDLSGLLQNAKGYYEILNTWERAFDGQISIKTKVYDLARFVEKNIVLDFIDWLGLAPDSEFALQSKS
jgi:hypothetical protein